MKKNHTQKNINKYSLLTNVSDRSRCQAHVCKKSEMIISTTTFWGFPGGASGKEPVFQCRGCKKHGFDPWVGKTPWRRAWPPTPVFLPGEFHGQRSLVGCSL